MTDQKIDGGGEKRPTGSGLSSVGLIVSFSAIPAIFVAAIVLTELIHRKFGPLPEAGYGGMAFGLGFVLLICMITMSRLLVKGDAKNPSKRGKMSIHEPGIFEAGLRIVGKFESKLPWLFLAIFVASRIGSKLWRDEDKIALEPSDYFMDTIGFFARSFGLPFAVIVLIVLAVGLLAKRKRAAR